MSNINVKHIQNLTKQIENATDCQALTLIFEQHLDGVTDLVEAKIETQLEILKTYLPLLNLPGPSPTAILKWLKKLVTGTIMPQLQAYITLIIQIAELQRAIQDLISAINDADDRLKRCLEDGIINNAKFQLEVKINELTQPIDDALITVGSLESQIKNVIDDPSDPFIVTNNLEGFLETADDGFALLGLAVADFGNEEIEPSPEPFSGFANTDSTSIEMKDGLVVNVTGASNNLGEIQTLPSESTINFDVSNTINFDVTLTQNTEFTFSGLAFASGQSGLIVINQDSVGGHEFTLPPEAKTPVGGAQIAQVTDPNSSNIINYLVINETSVFINYIGDFQ